jgi:hypothetical protein
MEPTVGVMPYAGRHGDAVMLIRRVLGALWALSSS